jgi:hypothetical protein
LVPEFDKLSRNPVTSSRCRRIPGIPCQIPAKLAGAAGSPAISPDPGQNAGDPAIWPGYWPERLDPASWLETGQDGRHPVNWPESGCFVPDSGKDHRNPAI